MPYDKILFTFISNNKLVYGSNFFLCFNINDYHSFHVQIIDINNVVLSVIKKTYKIYAVNNTQKPKVLLNIKILIILNYGFLL